MEVTSGTLEEDQERCLEFGSKRIMAATPFDNLHKAEPSLDPQRAESSRQHVCALNTQFASWVQSQLQNHPDELLEDGLQDYLTHASLIKSTDPTDKDAWKDRGMGQLSIERKVSVSKATKESKPTVLVRIDVHNTVTKDHISELPADILSCILSLLTMRDAVKARVLSPRWRYLCIAPSNLHFDLLSIFGINHDRSYLDKNLETLWEGKLRFVMAVDQCLQLCTSPKIESFKVRYCLGSESANHIDSWVSFALRKQTEELCLDFSFVPLSCELYWFPCHLFPQGKASQLKHLSLTSCALKRSPEFTNCLSSLTKLKLNNVSLDQSGFSDIFSGCANLEFLRLKVCKLPATFFIVGLPQLRKLFLKRCDQVHQVEKIVISCINLTTLYFSGMVNVLRFIDVPSLRDVYVSPPPYRDYFFYNPADDLPQIQNLVQVLFISKFWRPVPANMTRFCHLVKLDLMVFSLTRFNLLSIAFILNAAPHLQKFHLAFQHQVIDGGVTWEYSEQLYPQLKEVEMSGFYDQCNSLGLATYLLKNAVGLERMIIDSRPKRYRGSGRWEYYSREFMTKTEKDRVHAVLSKEKVNENVELIIV